MLLPFYCVCIVTASLLGGFLPDWLRMSHTRLQLLMSSVGGFMLGVAVLHLLPHGVAVSQQPLDWALGWMLFGIVAMFFLIRVFHVHQHAIVEPTDHQTQEPHHAQEHSHACSHDPHPQHHHDPATDVHNQSFSWVGLALGLSLHTLIDGLALGAAIATGFAESFAIFLAVLLHKPLDALSITTTMAAGGWSKPQRSWANLGFSLMCPLGATLFYFGSANLGNAQNLVVGTALAFSAGVFLCVALADILPELSFHSHDRFTLSAALLIGVASAYAIGFLEPFHVHRLPAPNAVHVRDLPRGSP